MKKLVITLVLVLSTTVITLGGGIWLNKQVSNTGYPIIQIVNPTPYIVYCEVVGNNYYLDFYVNPNKTSRWYIEPQGYYQWRCV